MGSNLTYGAPTPDVAPEDPAAVGWCLRQCDCVYVYSAPYTAGLFFGACGLFCTDD